MPITNIISSNGRLSDREYKRPKETITESIQNQKDIEEKLQNYIELKSEEICYVTIGTHIRYISYDVKNKTELFRFGGLLMTVKEKYIILKGKEGKTFSVQRNIYDDKQNIVYQTRFFKKINKEELATQKLEKTVQYSNQVFTNQQSVIEKQQNEIEKLKKLIQKIAK